MLKNIRSIEVRSLEDRTLEFKKLPLIAGTGKLTIENTREDSGRKTTITVEATLSKYKDLLGKPLLLRVQWYDEAVARDRYRGYQIFVFGDEYLPAYIEYEDDEVLTISIKYETPLSFQEMCSYKV